MKVNNNATEKNSELPPSVCLHACLLSLSYLPTTNTIAPSGGPPRKESPKGNLNKGWNGKYLFLYLFYASGPPCIDSHGWAIFLHFSTRRGGYLLSQCLTPTFPVPPLMGPLLFCVYFPMYIPWSHGRRPQKKTSFFLLFPLFFLWFLPFFIFFKFIHFR